MRAIALHHGAQRPLPRQAQIVALQGVHRLLRALDALDHLVGGVVIQRGAGHRQAHDDAGIQVVHDREHPLGPRAAHIAVARDPGQRRQRVH